MKPRVTEIILSSEAPDQRTAYRVAVDTVDLNMSNLRDAYRTARIWSFTAIDRHVNERLPWDTVQHVSPGGAFVFTDFYRKDPDRTVPPVPSQGR